MLTLSDAQLNAWIALFIWPFTRMLGLFLVEPIYAYRGIPRRFKVSLAVMLTILITPLLPPFPDIPLVSAAGIVILLQQLMIGLALGYIMRLVMTGVELAGFLIGTQAGLGFAMFFDPIHFAQIPVLSQLLTLFAFLLFLGFDGHQIVLSILIQSYQVLPIGISMPENGIKALVNWGSYIISWGIRLSLPVIGALLVANLAIGVMTRAAPQFNIFTFGFPLILLIGCISIYLTLPMMALVVEQIYQTGFEMMQALLRIK